MLLAQFSGIAFIAQKVLSVGNVKAILYRMEVNALAFVFIIRLFGTSAFCVPKYEKCFSWAFPSQD